jgi:anti-sigma B factor antagonist
MSTSPGSRHISVPTEAATEVRTAAESASVPFSVQRSDDARGVVVRPSGELDLGSASELEKLLAAILAEPAAEHPEQRPDRVLLDLSGLDFMDSTGIKVLVAAKQLADAQGRELTVCDPQPQVHRLLELVGLRDRLMADE